ncbi:PrsW family intramembrane metalloprotease [Streptomyces sanyensis]|uniref:PrsW family intramembrane metalloprotease n=1 Tax=Streptomyces sanyensis TaxID=568869 RepID=UPI0031E5F5BA
MSATPPEPSPPAFPPPPAVPPYAPDGAPPVPGAWAHRSARLRAALLWRSRAVRMAAVFTLLALCGLVILVLVREQTGSTGFLVGLGLATLPVPLLLAAFRWLDRVDPLPWRNLVFSFAWGACAAALISLLANTLATRWIATATADPASADTLGATVVAPVVEESAKGVALLLLFLLRGREFSGVVDGIVLAGFTATGFAFTENILYLGNAFDEDMAFGFAGLGSVTAATFFVRIVMSPFAHPLFTVLCGLGFGLAAAAPCGRRVRRVLLPLLGLLAAMGMHALWNGSASLLGPWGFFGVYGAFMVPAFALLTWLTVWSRQRELRTIAARLPSYAAAGWLTATEPSALSSMRARAMARDFARRTYGPAAGRTVAEYEAFATSLAFLRNRAHRGAAGPDFAERERELLHHLWLRREVAAPSLAYAARATGRAPQVLPHRDYDGFNPYRT